MEQTSPAISALDLNAWLGWQLDHFNAWHATVETDWLRLPTGNAGFPVLASLVDHAFTPLHRYSDQVLGEEPVAPESLAQAAWPQLYAWAKVCLARHRAACQAAAPDPQRRVPFKTRSAGVLTVSANYALVHAATHCLWHLGGIVHLLRQAGIAPPQKSDLLFWALEQE